MVDLLAVDHPVLLPGPMPTSPVWDDDPAALPAVALRRRFPGAMLEVGSRDARVPMLCWLADPDHPVFVVTLSTDDDRAVTRACALNGIAVGRGLPDLPLTVVVVRSSLPRDVAARIERDQPLLIAGDALEVPAGYEVVDSHAGVLAPGHVAQSAREAIARARADRADTAPPWLNAGTTAALRLLEQERLEAQAREAALQERTRRAYDQMRSARDQMIRLRLRKKR